jgi:hypothetical protein
MKSKMISDVYVEPCGWQGQNGHTTYRGIKGGIRIYFRQTDFLLLLSLDTWLTWPSEEASSANPRRVFSILQAQIQTKGRPWWCHVTGPKIASTIGAVCGNDVVAPTRTKIQNGDWWSETPFVKEERADGEDLGFLFDRSELKSSVFSLTCCDFMKVYPGMALWRRQCRRIELTFAESTGTNPQICGYRPKLANTFVGTLDKSFILSWLDSVVHSCSCMLWILMEGEGFLQKKWETL